MVQLIYFLNKRHDVNLPKVRKLDPSCLFREKKKLWFRQYIGADVSFPPYYWALLSLWVSFHILNRQSGSKGWNLSRHRLLIMLVRAEKELRFLHKSCMFKRQIAIDRHSPGQYPTNAIFLTHVIFRYYLPLKCPKYIIFAKNSKTKENRKGRFLLLFSNSFQAKLWLLCRICTPSPIHTSPSLRLSSADTDSQRHADNDNLLAPVSLQHKILSRLVVGRPPGQEHNY